MIWILPPKSKIAFPLSGKKLCSANIFSLALRSANKFVSATRRRRRPVGTSEELASQRARKSLDATKVASKRAARSSGPARP